MTEPRCITGRPHAGPAEGGITWLNPKEDPISASQRPTGGDKAIAGQKKQYFRRKKVCRFCVDKIDDINYKDVSCCTPSSPSAARSRRGVFRASAPRISGGWRTRSSRRATSLLLPFATSF